MIRKMVQDNINNNLDIFRMRLLNQAVEGLEIAERGVNLPIIERVVFVIRRRAENRRQINRVRAQLLHVVELFDDSGQIAAEKVRTLLMTDLRQVIPIFGNRARRVEAAPNFVVNGQIIPDMKAIRENLIDNA